MDATGRVATFTPTSLLAVNSQYYVLLTNGIQDATGNTFPQYGYQSFYTVDSANTTPPTVIAANPPANAANVGTNVTVQVEFSTDMSQQSQTGLVVSTGGNPVTGTWAWNANVSCCSWGPGTILSFTPTSPYAANKVYTVTYGSPLADTAGNALTPGSFAFTTGSGADTSQNNTSPVFAAGETNLGTNFAPSLTYSKPINPIDINTSTVQLYNGDSGKYVQGTVTVAHNGMSATFTPTYPLLPDTYYYLHQSCGNYDMDGNYLNCNNWYFTTGAGSDTTAPTVASISPANSATGVPLNAQITVHFSAPINESSLTNAITVTPSGGSAIAGTATLGSDLMTFTFAPTAALKPGTSFTVHVSGYQDMVGNTGTAFSSTFCQLRAPQRAHQRFHWPQRLRPTNHNRRHGRRALAGVHNRNHHHSVGEYVRLAVAGGRAAAFDCRFRRNRLLWRLAGERTNFGLDQHQSEQHLRQHLRTLLHNLQRAWLQCAGKSVPGRRVIHR